MASKCITFFFLQIFAISVYQICTFPTPNVPDDKTIHIRELNEERPLQEQMAEADRVSESKSVGNKRQTEPRAPHTDLGKDDFRMLKSLLDKSKVSDSEAPADETVGRNYFPDDSDSKNRRLAENYDSTKSDVAYKYEDDPDSFRTIDGTPLTAKDIVQKIAAKIYEEDDRGVFDRIVSKLLKLGLITESQAETLEYEVAEVLQDLISKNARENEVEDRSMEYPVAREEDDEVEEDPEEAVENSDRNFEEVPDMEDGEEAVEGVENTWKLPTELDRRSQLAADSGLEDLQYFPNFYNLLKSLDSEEDAEERKTLITIMKTLIDFVKMMVKYGTITPEEGVSYLENLDTMIAVQTKNKLGKSLVTPDIQAPTVKPNSVVDSTKEETTKIQKVYEPLRDTAKDNQALAETDNSGRSESYLEAIRKNIAWLKKHDKEGNKEDYDLPKLRDFMDRQVETYINKGILGTDEGEVIKRIYSSL
ncbi:secretogranin-3-like [Brienomyrus brachyistius]|uniref:secretogranin-3-like n=1 Tax=Brienomyrus brachyistius TaxID=42636 RepID=UPI0020B3B429|nr:secretogranin-3-like [Brienomyrus brachyistius]